MTTKVRSLKAGTGYAFEMRAVNDVGVGPAVRGRLAPARYIGATVTLQGERLGAGGRAVHGSGAPQRVVDRGHVRLLRAERQRVREPVRAPGSVFRGERDHGNGDLRSPVRHCAPEPAHVHGASQRGEGRLCDFLGHGDGHRGGRRCGLERGGCQRARGGGGEAPVLWCAWTAPGTGPSGWTMPRPTARRVRGVTTPRCRAR